MTRPRVEDESSELWYENEGDFASATHMAWQNLAVFPRTNGQNQPIRIDDSFTS